MEPRPGTVLLVEDNEDHALLVRLAFRGAGIPNPVRVVGDGEEAIRYLAGGPPYDDRGRHPWPVLVLLDLGLPRRSGLEVLEWLEREVEPSRFGSLPVVVLSSLADPETVARAYALGARSFVVKPLDFRDLVATVRSLAKAWLRARPGGEEGNLRAGNGEPS